MSCSCCGKSGHNAKTCTAPEGRTVQVWTVGKGLALDALIDLLLRSRGYGGIANCLAEITEPEAWAERLYYLADCTAIEDLLTLAARAYRDDALLPRMRALATELRDQDLLLDRPASVHILQALAELQAA